MNRRTRLILPLIGLVSTALIVMTAPAPAQVFDAWSADSGFRVNEPQPSARLQGMGGMDVAVADENREIQLWDFSRNLAGLLSDKPVHHIDVVAGPRSWKDPTTVELGDQNYRSFPTLFFVNLKPEPSIALGGGVAFTSATAERLVNDPLRRRFTLPLEDGATAPVQDQIVDAGLQGALFSAHYVHQLTERLAAGLQWEFWLQDERKGTPTVYKVEHVAKTHHVNGSLAFEVVPAGSGSGLVRGLVVGANGRIGHTQVDGESLDDVHRDTFDWDRPEVAASIHAIGEFDGDMKAGVDFRYGSFEGQEIVQINWSPLFFMNATPFTLETTRETFSEGARYKGVNARWEMRSPGRPWHLGTSFTASQEQYWQLPGLNVNSFLTAKNLQLTSWKAVGGGAYYLGGGRGLLAGEMALGFADLDDAISSPTQRTPTSTLELGLGGEYFPEMQIGIRGGYRRIKFDGDRDISDAAPDETTNRYALGLAYRLPDGMWQIDAGFMYDQIAREDPDPAVEDMSRSVFTLQMRWLL